MEDDRQGTAKKLLTYCEFKNDRQLRLIKKFIDYEPMPICCFEKGGSFACKLYNGYETCIHYNYKKKTKPELNKNVRILFKITKVSYKYFLKPYLSKLKNKEKKTRHLITTKLISST